MRKLVVFAFAFTLAVAASIAPAMANHDDPKCTLTVHHPLGTDEVPLPDSGLSPIDDLPTDLGSLKVFVDCQRGGGQGGGNGGGNGGGRS